MKVKGQETNLEFENNYCYAKLHIIKELFRHVHSGHAIIWPYQVPNNHRTIQTNIHCHAIIWSSKMNEQHNHLV